MVNKVTNDKSLPQKRNGGRRKSTKIAQLQITKTKEVKSRAGTINTMPNSQYCLAQLHRLNEAGY